MDPELLKKVATELLEAFGASVESIDLSSGHRTVIAVTTKDPNALIGPRGEHLRAFNTLLRRLAENKFGEDTPGFLLDVNGYHEEQMERVRAQARMLAQRARLFKHDVELEPMSSYERLVIHELFAEDPDIKTTSEGEGKFRHVVLKYKV